MNLKSTLWTLAFAVAAVSCSDELEGGPNNPQEEGVDGPITYVKVSVSQDVTTRAAGGEEGDSSNDQGESGSVDEYTVNDVTIILYRNHLDEGQSWTSSSPLSAFAANSELVAAGHAKAGNMSVSDETWHDWQSTVPITVTGDDSFDGCTYGIIAVTNLGEKDGKALVGRIKPDDINTGSELANLLQTTAWSESGEKANAFIMSTHNDTYGSGATATEIFDKVVLRENSTETNPVEATIHVERLAAKIRIQETSTTGVSDFIYKTGTGDSEAKVRLDHVAIVNQLTSGTYLLKRVTSNTTDNPADIPAQTDGHDNYLGNEVWAATGASNYVIDPWTRAKTANAVGTAVTSATLTPAGSPTGVTSATLSYDNPFIADATAKGYTNGTYGAMWNSLPDGTTQLAGNTAFDTEDAQVLLAYTQENTTSAANSLNGYSTGALFKATYFPKKYMATTTSGQTTSVSAVEVDYNGDTEGYGYDEITAGSPAQGDQEKVEATKGVTFYVYGSSDGENLNVYRDYEAIFNYYVFGIQSALRGQSGATIYAYSDFMNGKITNIKKADFKAHMLGSGSYNDPLGYIAHLIKECDGAAKDETFAITDAIETWVGAKTQTDYANAGINTYTGGVCYYPYWIKHADNSVDTEMGIMEFAIVRNNIYDLAVSSISGLGLSDIDKPKPGDKDEADKLYLNVRLLVKNWVVRNNNGIIL